MYRPSLLGDEGEGEGCSGSSVEAETVCDDGNNGSGEKEDDENDNKEDNRHEASCKPPKYAPPVDEYSRTRMVAVVSVFVVLTLLFSMLVDSLFCREGYLSQGSAVHARRAYDERNRLDSDWLLLQDHDDTSVMPSPVTEDKSDVDHLLQPEALPSSSPEYSSSSQQDNSSDHSMILDKNPIPDKDEHVLHFKVTIRAATTLVDIGQHPDFEATATVTSSNATKHEPCSCECILPNAKKSGESSDGRDDRNDDDHEGEFHSVEYTDTDADTDHGRQGEGHEHETHVEAEEPETTATDDFDPHKSSLSPQENAAAAAATVSAALLDTPHSYPHPDSSPNADAEMQLRDEAGGIPIEVN